MNAADMKKVEHAVNEMIDGFATQYPADFIEACEVMVDFAQTAIDARREENAAEDGDD